MSTVLEAPATVEHIATTAALHAATIAARFADSDQPDDLLAAIDELNGVADVIRWARRDLAGDLSEAGRQALTTIRQIDARDLQAALDDPTTNPDDVAHAQRCVAQIDAASQINFQRKWAAGRALAEGK